MADHVWIGNIAARQDVYTFTVGGTFEAGDLFNTGIQTTNYQIVATTDNNTTAGLIEDALTASTQPEFMEATYTVATNVVTATVKAANAGKPINFILSTTETGGGAADLQTYTLGGALTNYQGPNVLTPGNLNTNTTPTVGDSLYFQESSVDVKWLLDDWAAEGTLALLDIQASYTGKIGLPRRNTDTVGAHYNEYRPRYLDIRATNVRIGWGEGSGSGRIMLNMGSVQTTVTVHKTGTTVDDGYHALRIKGTHASNALVVFAGSVDVAPDDNDASTFATISVFGTGIVRTGPKVTPGTVFVGGQGKITMNHSTGTITRFQVHDNATATVNGTNAITDLYIRSGTFNYMGSGNIGTITVGPGGHFDASNNPNAFTVTGAVTIYEGAKFSDPAQKGTYSTAWQYHCDEYEAIVKRGKRFQSTISVIT